MNPYHVMIVYWRSAFAELLAGALLPLLLLYLLRSEEEESSLDDLVFGRDRGCGLADQRAIRGDAHLLAGIAGRMCSPSCAARREFCCVRCSLGLGLALAAFYVVPAIYEQKWVEIAQVLSPGVRPQDNFLFTTINDPDHNRFNVLVSVVARPSFCCWQFRCSCRGNGAARYPRAGGCWSSGELRRRC